MKLTDFFDSELLKKISRYELYDSSGTMVESIRLNEYLILGVPSSFLQPVSSFTLMQKPDGSYKVSAREV